MKKLLEVTGIKLKVMCAKLLTAYCCIAITELMLLEQYTKKSFLKLELKKSRRL